MQVAVDNKIDGPDGGCRHGCRHLFSPNVSFAWCPRSIARAPDRRNSWNFGLCLKQIAATVQASTRSCGAYHDYVAPQRSEVQFQARLPTSILPPVSKVRQTLRHTCVRDEIKLVETDCGNRAGSRRIQICRRGLNPSSGCTDVLAGTVATIHSQHIQ